MTLIHQFARRLHQLREDSSLTQEDLAARSGLTPTYISQLERAEKQPSLDTLAKLAHGLRVSIGTVVEFESTGDRKRKEIDIVVERLEVCELDQVRRIRRAVDALVG